MLDMNHFSENKEEKNAHSIASAFNLQTFILKELGNSEVCQVKRGLYNDRLPAALSFLGDVLFEISHMI